MPRMQLQQAFEIALGLHREGRLDEAANVYRQILEQAPDEPDAAYLLGRIAADRGQHRSALELLRRAVRANPGVAAYHAHLGRAHLQLGELDEAAAALERAVAHAPERADAWNDLGAVRLLAGQVADAVDTFSRGLAAAPDPRLHSQLIVTLHYDPRAGGADILAECRRWGARYAAPLAAAQGPHANDRDPDRRLRVGYVAATLYDHACSFFSLPLFEGHDPAAVELVGYADVATPDEVTRRHRAAAARWHDTTRLSDEALARLVRDDAIDVLVDCHVHTRGHRLGVFARRPAPVQVSWLGYAGTTGLDTFDARLTDAFLDPPGADDGAYSEPSIRLPHSFWCFDPRTEEPAVGTLPSAAGAPLTFGSLNLFGKLNEGVLRLWARVLRAVDGSRLAVLADPGAHRERALAVLRGEGVDAARVRFERRRRRPEYLALYEGIDVALDTFPWTGGTTTLDALWMGVPVVTLPGGTAVSRGSRSILSNAGLPDLVARDADDFVRIARALAGDPARLAGLRASLRERLRRSPLMDGRRFAQGFEEAYRTLWRAWCARASAGA